MYSLYSYAKCTRKARTRNVLALLVRIKVQQVGRKPSSVTTLSKDYTYYVSL